MESGARSVGASPYNPITDEPGRFSAPYNRERRERERERRRKVYLFLPPMTLHAVGSPACISAAVAAAAAGATLCLSASSLPMSCLSTCALTAGGHVTFTALYLSINAAAWGYAFTSNPRSCAICFFVSLIASGPNLDSE